jgi:Agrobacterium tumefaciens protein Atu4866
MADGGFLINAMAVVFSLIAAFGIFGKAFGETAKRKQDIRAEEVDVVSRLVGMWITGDGQVQRDVRADGRFVERNAVSDKPTREGRYEIVGDKVAYYDDAGVRSDGVYKDGILYHAGLIFYRR